MSTGTKVALVLGSIYGIGAVYAYVTEQDRQYALRRAIAWPIMPFLPRSGLLT